MEVQKSQTVDSDRIREYLFACNDSSSPVLFRGLISSWPASQWRVEEMEKIFGMKKVEFRVGHCKKGDEFETECQYVKSTIADFLSWLKQPDVEDKSNPFTNFAPNEYYAYADYQYMKEVFGDDDAVLKAVDWSCFGLRGRNGSQSTFWLGSGGAQTHCHYDTYGLNLVAQIDGSKRWALFPPSDSAYLYPTRIPYEESSVFSEVNLRNPDLRRHPLFSKATPYVVTLQPGDVLFVPRHWWHYVECLEPAISINTWVEIEQDNEARVDEALTRTVISSFASHLSEEDRQLRLVNPNETLFSLETNLQLLDHAIDITDHHSTVHDGDAKKRKQEGDNDADQEQDGRDSPPRKRAKLEDIFSADFIQRIEPMSVEDYLKLRFSEQQAERKGGQSPRSSDSSSSSHLDEEPDAETDNMPSPPTSDYQAVLRDVAQPFDGENHVQPSRASAHRENPTPPDSDSTFSTSSSSVQGEPPIVADQFLFDVLKSLTHPSAISTSRKALFDRVPK